MRRCNVYSVKGRIVFQPVGSSIPNGDPAIASGPVQWLPLSNATNVAIGAAIHAAFEHSSRRVEWPKDWKAVLAPLLEAAQVKTERALMKASKTLQVDLEDGTCTVTPLSIADLREGWLTVDERIERFADGDDAALGSAIRNALERPA